MSFTWIPFYKEFAHKLLEYKNRRQELVETIYSALDNTQNDSGTSVVNYFKKDKDERLTDTDPFSVFAIFNRTSNVKVRRECVTILKECFHISATVPSDFDGIPVLNAQKSIFVYQNGKTVEQDNLLLWNLFEKAVNNEDFGQEYDEALKIKGVNNNLSMGLFWICPDRFLALDSQNRAFIEKELGLKIKKEPNYKEYSQILSQVNDYMSKNTALCKNFAELSLLAWEKSNNENNDTMKDFEKYVTLLEKNHNIVFTGAPGTGKTYLARQIANFKVLDKTDIETLSDTEKAIIKERVGFVQFHPSYDYTDFVEGLRPISDDNGNVGFERKDGIFKEFCKRAILNSSSSEVVTNELNADPVVWKVSLAGTGDNPIRTECMENGHIRIGWADYGDVDDFYDFDNFKYGGKAILRAFQYSMEIGDIVVSCYSESEIDAIGIVTGEYEYHEDGGEFPRYRNVNWIAKGLRENIVKLNGDRKFTLSTIYRTCITPEAILKLANSHLQPNNDTSIDKKFVFIIDEINRGEISKIFGELFFSIDPGYRGEKGKVCTQYQNMISEGDVFADGFYVPDNVYIIGTMNDIDRSVESMDFAMRRRFTWKEISAESQKNMLDSLGEYAQEAKDSMTALNKVIEGTPELGKAYEIGPAYFLKLKNCNYDFDSLWEMNIEPLLREYLRGYRNGKEIIEKCKNAYDLKNKDVSNDRFGG